MLRYLLPLWYNKFNNLPFPNTKAEAEEQALLALHLHRHNNIPVRSIGTINTPCNPNRLQALLVPSNKPTGHEFMDMCDDRFRHTKLPVDDMTSVDEENGLGSF